jgi:hypothetical protein
MLTRKMAILLTAGLAMVTMFAGPVLAAPQSLDEAKAFLARLYAGYRPNAYSDYLAPAKARTIFAPRLLDLMKRDTVAADAAGEVGALDGDPICGCQEPDGLKVQSLTVSAAGIGKARAEVVFSLYEDVRHLTFDLEDLGQGWRIADVHSADTPSLVGLLEDGLKARSKTPGR